MAFKTGRSRSLTWNGTITGRFANVVVVSLPGDPNPSRQFSTGGSAVLDWGSGISFSWGGPTNTVTVNNGLGGSASNSNTSWASPSRDYDYSATGSYSISASLVEEWCEPYVPGVSDTIDGDSWPNHGGSAIVDGVPAIGAQFYEIAPAGATLTVTCSFGGATATVTTTLAAPLLIGYILSVDFRQDAFVTDISYSPQATFSYPHSLTSWSKSLANMNGTSSVSVSGSTITLTSTPATGSGATLRARFAGYAQPDTQLSFSCRLRSFGSAYPASLNAAVLHKNAELYAVNCAPNGSYDWTQKFYSYVGELGGTPTLDGTLYTSALDERTPVRAHLTPESLSGAGEDGRDWRLQFRGRKWDALTLSWGDYVIDDADVAGRWSGASVSGSEAVVTGGTPATLTPALLGTRATASRYLRLRVKGDAAHTATVSIAGKTWNIPVTTTYANVDLDLCRATSETEERKYRDTQFPVQSPGGFPTNEDPTVLADLGWGVERFNSIGFSCPSGRTLTIDRVTAVSTTRRRATWLQPFATFSAGWTSPSDTTSLQRGVDLEADGRVVDWPHAARIVPVSGSPLWRGYRISEMAGFLGFRRPWSIVSLSDLTDGYHTSDLYAGLLCGGGATFDHGSATWTDWVDAAVGTIPCQDLFDEVMVYPQIGNPFDPGSSYGGAIPLRVTKFLRSQATGLAYNSSGPESGASIELRRSSDNALRGSATSDPLGAFYTGSPWGSGNALHRFGIAGSPDSERLERAVANRLRLRGAFTSIPQGAKHPTHLQVDGRIFAAWVTSDGKIQAACAYADVPVPNWARVVDVVPSGSRPALWSDPVTQRLYLLYEIDRSDLSPQRWQVWRTWSDDDARTWASPELRADYMRLPRIGQSRDGGSLEITAQYVSGTSGSLRLTGRWRDLGSDWSSPFTLLTDTGSELRTTEQGWGDCQAGWEPYAPLTLSIVADGESAVSVWISANQGRTWKRAS